MARSSTCCAFRLHGPPRCWMKLADVSGWVARRAAAFALSSAWLSLATTRAAGRGDSATSGVEFPHHIRLTENGRRADVLADTSRMTSSSACMPGRTGGRTVIPCRRPDRQAPAKEWVTLPLPGQPEPPRRSHPRKFSQVLPCFQAPVQGHGWHTVGECHERLPSATVVRGLLGRFMPRRPACGPGFSRSSDAEVSGPCRSGARITAAPCPVFAVGEGPDWSHQVVQAPELPPAPAIAARQAICATRPPTKRHLPA